MQYSMFQKFNTAFRQRVKMYIDNQAQLREIYDLPKGNAVKKELHALEQHSINFIQHAPFVTLATYAKSGLPDCSPRGGNAGFIKVINENCIIIPDAKGNNRLDSLVNILETKKVGCLFLIPGVDETLRINGIARISTDKKYLDQFIDEKRQPISCIEITIEEVFLHCAKSLMRSKLWDSETFIDRSSFPSMGQMVKDQLLLTDTPESQEDMAKRYQRDL